MSKETQVFEMVKEGNRTRQEIIEAADCTPGSFASYLSAFRNAAKLTGAPVCPVEVPSEDDPERKVFTVTTFEEAETLKAAQASTRKSAGPAKTPEERFLAAKKRLARCEKAEANASERADANEGNEELELRAEKATIERKLAELAFQEAVRALEDLGIDPDSVTEAPKEAEAVEDGGDDELL
jgi:hypothetical protein